jgi:hypothetical protein
MLKALPQKMASFGKKQESPVMCFIIKFLQPTPRVTHAASGKEGPEPDRVEMMGETSLARA